jgi:hypothetical protein
MGTRGETLASQFEQVLAELRKAIEGYPDGQWHNGSGEEGWTIAATAHHVGFQWPLEKEYLVAAAEGSPAPSYSWDDINARNAKHADEYEACSKAEVIALLRDEGAKMAAYVRGLSDEQLDRTMALPLANGAEVSTQQLIEGGVLIDHARAHTKSLLG